MSEGFNQKDFQYQYNPMMMGTKTQSISSKNLDIQELLKLELPNYQESYNEVYKVDDIYNPFLEKTVEIRKLAESFLNVIKNKYPNRYFILKKITKNIELWDLVLNKNLLVINEENSVQKIKSVLEVIIFFLTETLRLFFVLK